MSQREAVLTGLAERILGVAGGGSGSTTCCADFKEAAEVQPARHADIVIDNRILAAPRIVKR